MKRSEMLKMLTEIGNKYFHNDYDGECIASEMLDEVEKLGMLPAFKNDRVDHVCGANDICNCNHIWESEDQNS